jgi:ring-1,2-phenylacetyl-CoA epoxidase subunit PaaE
MRNYYTLNIQKIIKETEDTFSFIFDTNDQNDFSFEPGQFLTLVFEKENNLELRRSFSISSSPAELPMLRITIKSVDSEFGSICKTLKIGDKVRTFPPVGNFVIGKNFNSEKLFVFIGAGSGITPLISKINYLLRATQNKIFLLYGNRTEKDIIFNDELSILQNEFGERFTIIHTLSQPSENWEFAKGRISPEVLKSYISPLIEQFKDIEYHICGPQLLMKNTISVLNDLGVKNESIKKEDFICQITHDSDEYETVERQITLFYKKQKFQLIIPANQSILETALRNRINLPNSCNNGSCGTCRAILLSGKIFLKNQTCLSEESTNNGFCLTCVGYPITDDVVIFYEDPFDF